MFPKVISGAGWECFQSIIRYFAELHANGSKQQNSLYFDQGRKVLLARLASAVSDKHASVRACCLSGLAVLLRNYTGPNDEDSHPNVDSEAHEGGDQRAHESIEFEVVQSSVQNTRFYNDKVDVAGSANPLDANNEDAEIGAQSILDTIEFAISEGNLCVYMCIYMQMCIFTNQSNFSPHVVECRSKFAYEVALLVLCFFECVSSNTILTHNIIFMVVSRVEGWGQPSACIRPVSSH